MTTLRRGATVTTLALVGASLAGCVPLDPDVDQQFAILDEDATEEDRLPEEPYDEAYSLVDPATARYAGEIDGTRMWMSLSTSGSDVCVVVLPAAPRSAQVGCSRATSVGQGAEHMRLGLTRGGDVHLLADGEPQMDTSAWQQVSENIWVE